MKLVQILIFKLLELFCKECLYILRIENTKIYNLNSVKRSVGNGQTISYQLNRISSLNYLL